MAAPTRTPVTSSHIELDERGVAWVTDTNTKVEEIVLDWQAHGLSPGEIHEHYPDLPLAKIHAAFAYYFEHQDEIDRRIADGEAWARAQWETSREAGAALHERLIARLPAQ